MVTFEQVQDAAEALTRAGQVVTMRAIHATIGGSMRDISKHYKTLRQPPPRPVPRPDAAPVALPRNGTVHQEPAPVPQDVLERLQHYHALAVQRLAEVHGEQQRHVALLSRGMQAVGDIPTYNRKSNALEAERRQLERDIVQYRGEISREQKRRGLV